MKPLYIFDLDGTLADIDHRRHLVQNKKEICSACKGTGGIIYMPPCASCNGKGERNGESQPNWPEFYRLCVNDTPKWPVINTMIALARQGADVWIWSGRSAEVMNETREWLQRYIPGDELEEVELCMRREGDYTPDEQLKAGWYDALTEYDQRRLVAIFDDRQKVVDMWRSKGLTCFQVAPGNF
ncbi:hypothetical protein [Limnobacter sp. P1]|uniref:phosphatase domain-containing protein n=1 Tax=Limnobacter olei TaxID=3031298 RepID=UPI0023B17296|nr:hypothetical protein [Limnobacter sp. P1]